MVEDAAELSLKEVDFTGGEFQSGQSSQIRDVDQMVGLGIGCGHDGTESYLPIGES
jgi:hypothetical protein